MRIARAVAEVRQQVGDWKRQGERVAFVPTMGALHAGHLSLVSLARVHAGRVVVSIFVNPLQFGPNEDFTRYPRDLESDCRRLDQVSGGVDLVFAPEVSVMYPDPFFTAVEVTGVSEGLCGASRPGHFKGVATVVAKLFGIVQPDVAVFGEKDAQQLAVIRALVRDLDYPIEIVGAPIVRDPDGLAMSSRNAYLSAEERAQALALPQALGMAAAEIQAGERNLADVTGRCRHRLAETPGLRLDYAEIVDPDTMKPPAAVGPGKNLLVLAAVFVGRTRLIDNRRVRAPE